MAGLVTPMIGDIFKSSAQTLVNTVNCVGVMGKGIALGFRQRFPEMHREYVSLCERGDVRLGRPYLWKAAVPPWILNFPTKDHWRQDSSLEAIVAGLEYLEEHYREWGIASLAVPPLGSGLGGLDWRIVGRVLYQHLTRLDIPVELYAPVDVPSDQLTHDLLSAMPTEINGRPRVGAVAVAVATIVERLAREPFRPRTGRIAFEKIAYFLTVAGVATGLEHGQETYGPASPDTAAMRRKLINHSILVERRMGQLIAVEPGRTLEKAKEVYATELAEWDPAIERVVDLFMRLRTARQAEVAATVHFAATTLGASSPAQPSELDVLKFVRKWKHRRSPPLTDLELANAIRGLNSRNWISIPASESLPVPP